jgi:Uma2 family endonuclease
VLSPSTQVFDLGKKFEDYSKLDSLEEYVLIFPDIEQVECRRRTADNAWVTVIYQAGDAVSLKSLGLEFDITELYCGLDS